MIFSHNGMIWLSNINRDGVINEEDTFQSQVNILLLNDIERI